jgi:endonuclease/exonuclease/phosphatase (EEP) superfamily protein YafD
MIDYLAVYLFIPLSLILLVSLVCKSWSLGIGITLGALTFAWFWGHLFTPRLAEPEENANTLTVMTYNVLAWHNHTEPILETILAEDPDIVLLQELNHNLALELKERLGDIYPFQILDPEDNPRGIGTISKYPIRATEETLPGEWIGGPQVMELEWRGEQVTLVNFHMWPTTGIRPLKEVERSFRLRETEARLMAELAEQREIAIFGGDANCTSLSEAYRILTGELIDSFREAGFGPGHTFPGSDIPGSDRPNLGGWYVPRWLARIDYVFHTPAWETVWSRVARFDDVSDHRGVVAVLQLLGE